MGVSSSHPKLSQPQWYDQLKGWSQERILSLNQAFRKSSSDFVVDSSEIVNLIQVDNHTAQKVCGELSRNVGKDSVNMMTLLAVSSMCVCVYVWYDNSLDACDIDFIFNN